MKISHTLLTARHPWPGAGTGIRYTLHLADDEFAGQAFVPGVGTVLTKPKQPAYNFVIYERDDDGYVGECGTFGGDKWDEAVKYLLGLAELDLPTILKAGLPADPKPGRRWRPKTKTTRTRKSKKQ